MLPTASEFVDAWRRIVVGEHKSWVVFRHGTCVVFTSTEADLRAKALDLMRQWGPVYPGCPAGDFSSIILSDYPGWVVTGHHNDILTYVAPKEVRSGAQDEISIGLYGRNKRDLDAKALEVIHVEDRHADPSH